MPRGKPAPKQRAPPASSPKPKRKRTSPSHSTAVEIQGGVPNPPSAIEAASSSINYEELAKHIVREQEKMRKANSTEKSALAEEPNIIPSVHNGPISSSNADSSNAPQPHVLTNVNAADPPLSLASSKALENLGTSDNVNLILDTIFMRVDCPAEDKWVCGRDWTPSYCKRFTNVPFDCSYMCGKCRSGSGTGTECRAYGDYGIDIGQCSSMGGSISCADCDRFYNVKRDMCPIMCGLCDHTCTCKCEPPYIGDRCQQADCSKPDKDHCPAWPNSYCDQCNNVPQDCPKKCGLC